MDIKYDVITHIENDIEKIQTKPGMYMSYLGDNGARHLSFEVINNAIDECINKNSPGDRIDITYNISTDILTVEDNGRGLPVKSMRVACTKINAGSKFTREQSGNSAGENGCGLTCVNAMSTMFNMIVNPYDEAREYHLEFSEGKEQKCYDVSGDKKIHGTRIEFAPSQKYLGRGTKMPYKEVIEWVRKQSYQIDEKIKITFEVYKGTKLVEEYKFKTSTIKDYLSEKIDGKIGPMIFLTKSTTFDEVKRITSKTNDVQKKNAKITFAFAYSNAVEPFTDSFCNFVNTIDNGDHLDGVKESICRYLAKATKDSLTEREKSKLDILWSDVQSGLNLVVNFQTNMEMIGFTGQTKQKIKSDEVLTLVKGMATDAIAKYFEDSPADLKAFVSIVKLNAKARIEMNKVKSGIIKESTDIWKEHQMKNFIPANNRGKQYKEIFIVEGDSAKGTTEAGRDPDTQAVFAIRGVSANSFKRDDKTILENVEFRDLVKVLGCNFGPKFDLSRLNYDKIIILTDADIDGFGIRSLLSAFFIKFMPEIVKAGKLYVGIPPLYEITDKKNPFVVDKHDYVDRFIKKILSEYEVFTNDSGKYPKLSDDELYDFIYDTKDYLDNLSDLSKHFKINAELIEKIMAFIALTTKGEQPTYEEVMKQINDNQVDFIAGIQKDYPEVTLEGDRVCGIIDGHYKMISISNRFIRKIKNLLPIVRKYGYNIKYRAKKSESDKKITDSIGNFLKLTIPYRPNIVTRFKGLGENDAADLWRSTLNPETRTLIQLNSENYDKEMEKFYVLHGVGKKNETARKEMMRAYTIDRDDLDN